MSKFFPKDKNGRRLKIGDYVFVSGEYAKVNVIFQEKNSEFDGDYDIGVICIRDDFPLVRDCRHCRYVSPEEIFLYNMEQ